jgi:transposase-like protein
LNTIRRIAVRKNNRYTDEFKKKVVQEYLGGPASADTIAKKYGIKSATQVKRWTKKWREHGSFPDNRGKGSTGRPRKVRREDMTDNEYIEYLEMNLELKKYMAFYEKRKQN